MKRYWPRFNQPSDTPDSELKRNPIRRYASCSCIRPHGEHGKYAFTEFHQEIQDTKIEAWRSLKHYIDSVRSSGAEIFDPISALGPEMWEQITTLPGSIGTLSSVKYLGLYGSHLVRIPPEIGDMASLEEFDLYTSYCLHWFPYEITRCQRLKLSRVSTRTLYGNYKLRPPFPRLPHHLDQLTPATCSVCNFEFPSNGPLQMWISLMVATDVLPLLVHACSEECILHLPEPPHGYVPKAHRGGLNVSQPPRSPIHP